MTREEEILGIALWADREHGTAAPAWIAAQIERLAADGETGGVELWNAVAAAWHSLVTATRH